MRAATLDRLLAVCVIAVAVTGLTSLRFGSPDGAWLFVVHGLLAGFLAAAIALKLGPSVSHALHARRLGRLALGLGVSAVAVGALVGGYAWVATGRLLEIGSWTVLTIHAWLGLAVVPLVAVHLLPHRWRLLRPTPRPITRTPVASMSRRSVLTAGGLTVVGLGLFGAAQLLDGLCGGQRRFTGSRWLPSCGVPPATTFLGDTPPPSEIATWRISVSGRVRQPVDLDLAALAGLGQIQLAAVLDCTSGWAIETAWSGTPLGAVLDAAGVDDSARGVTIRSATGWTSTLPVAEASECLLATHVAGAPLPVANGAPVRLVAPNRRGLDWVKWVREINVG
jgi:hypothetical protein